MPRRQPQHGRRELDAEVCCDQDDAHVVREHLLAAHPGLQDGAGVRLLQAALDDEPLALLHDLLEGHGAHHGGVAKSLQLAMAAVLSALELDHHKVTVDVDAQKVDPAVRAVELPELLRDQQDAVGYDLDLVPQQALQVIALAHLRRGERGLR